MSKDKKTRFFTQVFDDVIRNPNITSHDFRLYCLMASYSKKDSKSGPRICKLTKQGLAGILRVAERTIYDLTRNLENEDLIEIHYKNDDRRYPVYHIVENPPNKTPKKLQTNRLNDVLDYVREAGGVKKLQRRAHRARKATRRVGRPAGNTNGYTLETPDGTQDDDGPEDVSEAQVPAPMSPTDSDAGTTLPALLAEHCQQEPEQDPNQLAVHCHSAGSVLQSCWHNTASIAGSTLPPGTEKSREQCRERTTVLRTRRDMCPLGPPESNPALPLGPDEDQEAASVRRAARRDASQDEEDEDMGMSREQLEAERARRAAQADGERTSIKDVDTSRKSVSGASAGAEKTVSDETVKMYDETTPDPKNVHEVPKNPWRLFTHFKKVVYSRFPRASLPRAPTGRYMKEGKTLLNNYTREQLYEMIQILVLDYENIERSKMFFKQSGGPHPDYEQLFFNAGLLCKLIGIGIISPPVVRHSRYLDDYNRRKGLSASTTEKAEEKTSDKPGRKSNDPFDLIRDQDG